MTKHPIKKCTATLTALITLCAVCSCSPKGEIAESATISLPSNPIEAGLELLNNQDVSGAAASFSQAYESGDGEGAFYLGRMAEKGIGVPANLSRAATLYQAGAELGSANAMNRLGLMHLSGEGVLQDFELAANFVCEAADLGDVNAQFNCGNLLLQGKGLAPDPDKAIIMFEKSAAQDHIGAQNFLGLAYRSGQMVPADPDRARLHFARTAELGNPLGLFQMGIAFSDSENESDHDLIKAYMYFNLASALGHPDADKYRDDLLTKLNPADIAEAQKLASEWRAKTP